MFDGRVTADACGVLNLFARVRIFAFTILSETVQMRVGILVKVLM